MNGICTSPVLCRHFSASLECPLQWNYIAWAECMGGQLLSRQQASPSPPPPPPPILSTQLADPRERQVSIQLGHQRRRKSCRNDDVLSNRLRDSSSWFSVGVYSPSLSQEWVYRKAAVVSTQIYRRVLGRAHRNRGYHEKVLPLLLLLLSRRCANVIRPSSGFFCQGTVAQFDQWSQKLLELIRMHFYISSEINTFQVFKPNKTPNN